MLRPDEPPWEDEDFPDWHIDLLPGDASLASEYQVMSVDEEMCYNAKLALAIDRNAHGELWR